MRILLYGMIAFSFLAADTLAINIKIMQLSIFRGILFLTSIYFALEILKTNKKISISVKNDSSIIIKFYFLWFIYAVFSLNWVKDYHSWLRAVFFIGSGFLCIIILSHYVNSKEDFKKIFSIMFLMIVMHNIIGWHELITGAYRFADLSIMDKYNQFSWNPAARVPISMLGNPNDYATLMLFGVFISYINFTNTKFWFTKLLCSITIISSIMLIFKTDSRANILGLIVGIILFIYMKYFKKKGIKFLFAFIALSIIIGIFPNILDNLFILISDKLNFNFHGSSGSDIVRLNLIKNGLFFLKETIGFGVGAGNIEYWMENKNVYYIGHITNMHNWWMEILVGYGVVIFILYLCIYIKVIMCLYSVNLNIHDKFIKNVSLGLLCCLASFVIASISSSSNISKEWLWLFWGVVIAFIGFNRKIGEIYNDKIIHY